MENIFVKNLRCVSCGYEFPLSDTILKCPLCGANVEVMYDYERLKEVSNEGLFEASRSNIWRYRALLPVFSEKCIVSLDEGWTPLFEAKNLPERLNVSSKLILKNETINPTGSFLDRGSSVLVSRCLELGVSAIACVTTGNMGASLSAYCAKACISCTNFIPKLVELGKLYQTVIYGGKIIWCEDVDDATAKALKACNKGVYPALPNNPIFLDGLKTTAIEICEQMNWNVPNFVVVPIGNGGHIGMIWKGFWEMMQLGFTDEIPKLVGVQTARCAPVMEITGGIMRRGREIRSVAVDIAIKKPLNLYLAVRAIRESKGTVIAVSDDEMIESVSILAKSEGIFAEPAAASTVAAIKALSDEGIIERGDEVVCVLTGAGLKDPFTARELVRRAREVCGVLGDVEEFMGFRRIGRTKMLILEILKEKESYGYAIWKELRRKGRRISMPTVYQHLLELEAMGLIERIPRVVEDSRAGRRNKVLYKVTKIGLEILESLLRGRAGNTKA